MTWADFLKYSKGIAVFYVAAFLMALLGIWVPALGQKFIWTGGLLFCTALASNVALGIYHANHKGAMLVEKSQYMAAQNNPVTITGDGKTVANLTTPPSRLNTEMEEFLRDQNDQY